MIKESNPISMSEALEYAKEDRTGDTDVVGFIKKFIIIKTKDAKELRKKLKDLDFMKVRGEHISKIIDLLPENAEELNKIFVDVGLDEDESKKILEIVKEFK